MINSARKLFSSFWCTTTKSDSLLDPLITSRTTRNIELENNTSSEMITDLDPCLRVFSFKELKAATRNFHSDTVLGEDEFGTVYRGWIPDVSGDKRGNGSIVVVKSFYHESMLLESQSKAKVKLLGKLCHPNLEKVMGYGWNDNMLFLVYEFMQRGSLNNHLHPRGFREPLAWDIRVKILIEAARGLAFLHSPEVNVAYRDFKSSKILLDKSYHAKISHSALARTDPSTNHGQKWNNYVSPEFVMTGQATAKSDVYSFGVVSIEVLTGLRASDVKRPREQARLTDWIIPHLCKRGKLKNIIDPHMKGTAQIAQLALTCLDLQASRRPTMQQVVETLEKIDAQGC